MNPTKLTQMVVIVMMALAGFQASGVTTDGDFVVHSTPVDVSPDVSIEVILGNELPVNTTVKQEGFDVQVLIHQGPHSDTDHTVCANLHHLRLNSRQRRSQRLAGNSGQTSGRPTSGSPIVQPGSTSSVVGIRCRHGSEPEFWVSQPLC